jgi:hypothetical protein
LESLVHSQIRVPSRQFPVTVSFEPIALSLPFLA